MSMSASPLPIAPDLLRAVRDSCLEAGEIAVALFRPGAMTAARTWSKSGGSPVTEADIGVDTFLRIRLSVLMPEAAWLSEETVDDELRLSRRFVWVVDPIDGTRAFMNGSPDWAVCVALLDEGKPILGVVHAPACNATYTALLGGGAQRNGVAIAASMKTSLATARIAGPKPMLDALARLEAFEPTEKIPVTGAAAGADRGWDDRRRAGLARCARLGHRRRRSGAERGRGDAQRRHGATRHLQPRDAGPWHAGRQQREPCSAADVGLATHARRTVAADLTIFRA
jgi:fructose-1,6-bisphosphatase/inositol monophosphatase family enzyme